MTNRNTKPSKDITIELRKEKINTYTKVSLKILKHTGVLPSMIRK